MVFRIRVISVFLHVIGLATNKASEKGGDNGLGDDNFVIRCPTLEVEELHAYGLASKDFVEVIRGDTILGNKAFQNMKTLWGELVYATLLEEVGGAICRVLDKTCIHEVLRHGLCHFSGHGKGGGRGRGYDARRLAGIWTTIGLGELERREIYGGFIAVEREG